MSPKHPKHSAKLPKNSRAPQQTSGGASAKAPGSALSDPASSSRSASVTAAAETVVPAPAASSRRPFLFTCILLAAAVILGWYSYPQHPLYQGDITERGGGYDYFYYYSTSHALRDKIANIYASPEMLEYSRRLSGARDWAVSDNHPLPFYILYLPLFERSFSQGYYIHLWVNLNILWMAVFALCLTLLPSRRQAYILMLLFMGATVTVGPAVDNIYLGQIGLAFAGLLAFAFLFDRIGYGAPAGVCLALAILLKMYPALLLIYFALKHRWQTLKWTAYTLLALSAAAGLQWGFGRYLDYWHFLSRTMSYDSTVGNQSLIGVIANACPHLAPADLKAVHLCLLALTAGGLSWMSRNLPLRSPNAAMGLLEFSVWATAATAASPISWSHHHIFLILPLLAFLGIAGNPTLTVSPDHPDAEAKNDIQNAGQGKDRGPADKDAKTAAALTPNPIKVNWSAAIEVSPLKRGLAMTGIALIVLLWCLEGETVTNMGVKAVHYSFCACHLGIIVLLGILAAEIAVLTKE